MERPPGPRQRKPGGGCAMWARRCREARRAVTTRRRRRNQPFKSPLAKRTTHSARPVAVAKPLAGGGGTSRRNCPWPVDREVRERLITFPSSRQRHRPLANQDAISRANDPWRSDHVTQERIDRGQGGSKMAGGLASGHPLVGSERIGTVLTRPCGLPAWHREPEDVLENVVLLAEERS